MHNGYLYPDDVVITVVDGKRMFRIGWELPTLWTEDAIKASKSDYLAGWEMARMAYRKSVMDEWYKRTYPEYWAEKQEFALWMNNGGSVTGWSAGHEERQRARFANRGI